MVMISERPPEVADRAVPGHWEGDLLIGTKNNAIATLVERPTRYCQLVALPEGPGTEAVADGQAEHHDLPAQLRQRSATWTRAQRMSEHRCIQRRDRRGRGAAALRSPKPLAAGLQDNTNGLLRQYFPKGKSLEGVTQERLDEVADKLNRRPRETLGFRTPAEKLAELIEGFGEADSER